jgi:hypothetical protein
MGQGSRYTHALPQHLWPVADLLNNAAVGQIPDPWSDIAYVAVGGLEAVGFETVTERMLVVSSTGQSVIDCQTGEKLHRDRQRSAYDSSTLTAWPTNQDEDNRIQMCGLHGGALRTVTDDGWSIDAIPIYWPKYFFVLNHPNSSVFMSKLGRPVHISVLANDYQPRAFGFSWSGKTLIKSDGAGIYIWGRPD